MPIHAARLRDANAKPFGTQGPVVYWMQAAQRVLENPALVHAIEQANALRCELIVCFGITAYPGAERAHYEFMLEGLHEVASDLARRGIRFVCEERDPVQLALSFGARAIITDENYTRTPRAWRAALAEQALVRVTIVDSNVIVPVALLGKEEYAAYTIRPKLWQHAPAFLVETPLPAYHGAAMQQPRLPTLTLPLQNRARRTIPGGTSHALHRMRTFLAGIERYGERNDPTQRATSELSAYLHFGQISPVTIVLAASASARAKNEEQVQAFIEQLFVRREVAHNFTYYNAHYDTIEGCAPWARASLEKHRIDPRPILYTEAQFEQAQTHDPLWNAAQMEMVKTGTMHNYLRMLWAKKILEWTASPEEAFRIAVLLNDRYELDGRDPNGYAGIAWSIGGKHDRPWFERAIYGQIRYMSSDAAAKKFDAQAYIRRVNAL